MNLIKKFQWDLQQAYIQKLLSYGMVPEYIHEEINSGRLTNDIMAEFIKFFIKLHELDGDTNK